MINICNYTYKPQTGITVDTTSRSRNWSRELSPFLLGPVELYDGTFAQNVENAWQFSKVYRKHLNKNQDISNAWFEWSRAGFNDTRAHRYPMGKGVIPLCSYWNGQFLSYIEARKQIYIPLYSKAVVKTKAFKVLSVLAQHNNIWLRDFDGWNYRKWDMTLKDVVNCESKKMGHAFVLAMLLENYVAD